MSTHRLILQNQIEELTRLEQFITEVIADFQLPDSLIFEINLVLEELFTNVVFYAFPDQLTHAIVIEFELGEQELIIRVLDDGIAFDPTAKPPPEDINKPLEDREIGGLGIHLVKSMMDDVVYTRLGERNIITLKKIIK